MKSVTGTLQIKGEQALIPPRPGPGKQYKLVFTLFIIGCLGVQEAQWLKTLAQKSIKVAHFLYIKVSVKFHFKGLSCPRCDPFFVDMCISIHISISI